MIKIVSEKFNYQAEAYQFDLENGDVVLIHEKNLKDEAEWESLQERIYTPIFAEASYSDDPKEIVGFELNLVNMEEALEVIHKRTNDIYSVGSKGEYVTLYNSLEDFIEQSGGRQYNDIEEQEETNSEAFQRITDGEEWARLNHDSEKSFIAYDSAHASSSHVFLLKTDELSIEMFIDRITR